MKKKVLITGSRGLIGLGLIQTVPREFEVIPTVRKNILSKKIDFKLLDITDKAKLVSFFDKYKPDIIIHAASMGSVDYCETHKEEAKKVNVAGTYNLLKEARKRNIHFVFLSSNAIFDGLNPPYSERSRPHPVNYYGKTKLMAEEMIRRDIKNYLIIRLVQAYGWNSVAERENPVTWLLNNLKNNIITYLVNDTYVNPVLNIDAAKKIWKLILNNKKGIFHIAGKDSVNRYEFGVLTAKVFGYDPRLIKSVDSNYFKGIARRMPDTTYKTEKIEKTLNMESLSLIKGLREMRRKHYEV
jgi:dTDP-4-dehydrorhamnose reductase